MQSLAQARWRRTRAVELAIEGLSYDEIAAATESSLGTVKSRIARARARLQEQLGDLVGGGWP